MQEINNVDLVSESPDFSMFGLFMQADIVVKSVIIVLILASLYSWNVIVSKILRIKIAEVTNLLKDLSERHSIKDKDVLTMLRYYELVKELKNIKG